MCLLEQQQHMGTDRIGYSIVQNLPRSQEPCLLTAGAPSGPESVPALRCHRTKEMLHCPASTSVFRQSVLGTVVSPVFSITIIPQKKNESTTEASAQEEILSLSLPLRRCHVLGCRVVTGNFHSSPWAVVKPRLFCCFLYVEGYRSWRVS